MESKNESRTYRVRKLPPSVNKEDVAALLSRFPGFGSAECVRVHSIASSLHSWDPRPMKVATVTFTHPPEAFDDGKDQCVLEGHIVDLDQNIIVDCHFLGFTLLNQVDPQKHVLE